MTHSGILLPRFDASSFGQKLCNDLRSDHAGETGAVAIYKGILAISRDEEIRDFALMHLETEKTHLQILHSWMPSRLHSRLLPLWYFSGWMLGVTSALAGKKSVYITINAVERFVVDHYQQQIIDAPPKVRELLISLQQDEAHHRQDAEQRAEGATNGVLAKFWSGLIWHGSKLAVHVARVI